MNKLLEENVSLDLFFECLTSTSCFTSHKALIPERIFVEASVLCQWWSYCPVWLCLGVWGAFEEKGVIKFTGSCICRSRSRRERFGRNIFFPLWLCMDCETKPWSFFTVSFPNSLLSFLSFFQQEFEISLDWGTWVTDHILSAELLCQSEYYELLPHIYRFSTNLFNVSCSIYFETLIWKNILHFAIFFMWTSPSCRLVWDAVPPQRLPQPALVPCVRFCPLQQWQR